MTTRVTATALAALGLALATNGCSHVEPWERGNLAKPQMAADPHPAQRAMSDHVYSSREVGAAGASGQGGGCGCY